MSLMRPFSSIQNDFNRLFNEIERDLGTSLSLWSGRRQDDRSESMLSVWAPPVDVVENENEIIVKASIPGLGPEDVEVEVENNLMTIRGQTRKTGEEKTKNYYRREIVEGSFYRQIQLPNEVESEQASARFEHGMLIVAMPKSQQTRKHKVQIKQ